MRRERWMLWMLVGLSAIIGILLFFVPPLRRCRLERVPNNQWIALRPVPIAIRLL